VSDFTEAFSKNIVDRKAKSNEVDGKLKNKEQVIVTTHSTHIASYLELDNTVVLYKECNEVKIHYMLEGFGNSKDDINSINYLKKWLNATNSTMFYSRKIILVEGIAEQILVPIFFQYKYKKTLEKANCQVINVNGVAFEHFLRIVKNGYFVRTAVLTDSDEGKKTEHRADELKKKYDSSFINVCISDETTFEKAIFSVNSLKKINREFLVDIVNKLRPKKCNEDFCKEQKSKLDIEEMFNCVEEYKADFAFELSEALVLEMKKQGKANKFQIPKYIEEAFNFIEGAAT
jgi:predicted ATP-dependent endonuclease of OLD family